MINAEAISNKPKLKWPLCLVLFLVLMQSTTLISFSINDIQEVDATIKTKISALVDIENLGHVQSVQTTQIGPLTFFKFNFFAQENQQVSAKATQFLGFSPQITCVSGSQSYRCQ